MKCQFHGDICQSNQRIRQRGPEEELNLNSERTVGNYNGKGNDGWEEERKTSED